MTVTRAPLDLYCLPCYTKAFYIIEVCLFPLDVRYHMDGLHINMGQHIKLTSEGSQILLAHNSVASQEDEVAVVERFSKFSRVVRAGPLMLEQPLGVTVDTLCRRVSLRTNRIVSHTETKTKDNVFCSVEILVSYRLMQVFQNKLFKVLNVP